MKGKVKINPAQLVSFITIIIAFHYYMSYKWIYGLLEIYNLQHLSIITIEDILFPFVELNYTVIAMAGFGFIWIYAIQLAISEEDYSNFDKQALKGIENTWSSIKQLFSWLSNKFKGHKRAVILIAITSIVILTALSYLMRDYLELPKTGSLGTSYWLIFIVLPIVHVIWSQKRTLTMGLYLLTIFLWSNKFVNRIILDVKNDNKPSEYKTDLSFTYKNIPVSTSDSISFIHRSYKYTILKNNISEQIKLYPNDKIEAFTYRKRKITDAKNP